jgi:hypothetical protein
MDTSDLKNSAHFDYFFKMLIDGFTPKYAEGRAIEVTIDNSNNGEIIQLFPKDQLTINSIQLIDSALKKLEIKPYTLNSTRPCLLFYGCPQYMEAKIRQYFKQFSGNKESNLYNVEIEFKNGMNSLIGLHQNILAIIVWNEPANKDEIHQLIGRILRLNSWNNPLYFYITCKSSYEHIKIVEKDLPKQESEEESSSEESDEESEDKDEIKEVNEIDFIEEEETLLNRSIVIQNGTTFEEMESFNNPLNQSQMIEDDGLDFDDI